MNWDRREVSERLAKIGHVRLSLWFLGLGLLATIPLQVVVSWRGTAPGPGELLLRMLLALVSFGAAMIVFLWLVFRERKMTE